MNSPVLKIFSTIKKWIFWAYNRKSWQYDILCLLLILAIIFIPLKGPQRISPPKENSLKKAFILSEKKIGENLFSIMVKAEYSPSSGRDELENLKSAIKQLIGNKKDIRQIIPIIGENGDIIGFSILIKGKGKGKEK